MKNTYRLPIFNKKMMLFWVVFSFFFVIPSAFAGNTKHVPNKTTITYQSPISNGAPVTISWNVGDAAGCTPSSNYPNTEDGVYATWVSSNRTGAGSLFLGYPTNVGQWSFSCSSYSPAGAVDTSILTVGRPWGGTVSQPSDCTIPAGGSSCQITFNWTSFGLNSPDFTGCAYTGTHWGGSCGIPLAVVYQESGSVVYTVNPNGVYARISGTPDYATYQNGISAVNALGVCTGGSVWNGSTCGCSVAEALVNGACVSLNPTISSTANVGSGHSPTVTWSSTVPTDGANVQCEIARTFYLNSDNSDAWQIGNTISTTVGGNGSNSPEVFTTVAPTPKYVWYRIRCWSAGDGTSGQSTGWVSAPARTTVGNARVWFTP